MGAPKGPRQMPTQKTVARQWRYVRAVLCEEPGKQPHKFSGRFRLQEARQYATSGLDPATKWWAVFDGGRQRQFVFDLGIDDDETERARNPPDPPDDDDDGQLGDDDAQAWGPPQTPDERWLTSVERMALLNAKAYQTAFSTANEMIRTVLDSYEDVIETITDVLAAAAERTATLEARLQTMALDAADAATGQGPGAAKKADDADDAIAGLAKTVAKAAGEGMADKITRALSGEDAPK